MKILLTGANGFLGKHIVEGFKGNFQIATLSRNEANYSISLDKEVPDFLETFDLVIHAAGKAHSIPRTTEEEDEFYKVNVLGTLNLLRGLEKSGMPKQFVFISSVSVYGQETGNHIKESSNLSAEDPYGLSKIEAEKIIAEWCKTNSIVCTILRLPLLVGKNPPGNLGAMLNGIKKGYYFNIDGGKARKSMVLAKDVAVFIRQSASYGGIYNLTDTKHPSFSELSFAISGKESRNMPLSIANIVGKVGDYIGNKSPITTSKVKKITSDLTFDDSKAKELLNWKPESVVEYLSKEKLL